MLKNKHKSNQINPIRIQYNDSMHSLDPTKKPKCLRELTNANASTTLLNINLTSRHVHKSAVNNFNMDEYKDDMGLKNRTKCEANSQFDELENIPLTTIVYDYSHNVELGQGDTLKKDEQELSMYNIFDAAYLDKVDLRNEHTSTTTNYNHYNVHEWDYSEHTSKIKYRNQNKLTASSESEYIFYPEGQTPESVVVEPVKNQETFTNMPEYRFNPQTQMHKIINNYEYVYEKSQSDEENENDNKIKNKHTDTTDYIQMPKFETEQTLVKDRSKLKT